MDGHSSSVPCTVGPRVQFNSACEHAPLMTDQRIQQEAICYQWFKQRLILSVSKPIISASGHRLKRTPLNPLCLPENLISAYAAITWHNDQASPGLEPRLDDHCSQAARSTTLPLAPVGQADRLPFTTTNLHYPLKDIPAYQMKIFLSVFL